MAYPLLLNATLLPLVHWDLAERVQQLCLLISGDQPRHVDTQRVNRLPRVKKYGEAFPLNKDLKLLLPSPVGNPPSYKQALVRFSVHRGRWRPIRTLTMLVFLRPTRRLLRRNLMTLLSRTDRGSRGSHFAGDLDLRPYEGASRVRPVEDPGRPPGALLMREAR